MKRRNFKWLVVAMLHQALVVVWCASAAVDRGDASLLIPAAVALVGLILTFDGWSLLEESEDRRCGKT